MYVEVALPVPLDRLFTYQVMGESPAVGARVLVPFSGQKLVGIVVRAHDSAPAADVTLKSVDQVLDAYPLLEPELLQLAEWMTQYYVAPLGDVLRGMLPVSQVVKLTATYRITEAGLRVLFEGAERGSSRRSRLSESEQTSEYAVLNALQSGQGLCAVALRGIGGTKALLAGMLRKRWINKELQLHERKPRGRERIAVLAAEQLPPRLSANQSLILAELTACGGRMHVRDILQLPVPQTTLRTLVRRGLVVLQDVIPAGASPGTPFSAAPSSGHALNEAQALVLASVEAALAENRFEAFLLQGVTGSGKTAVYLAAMQRCQEQGRSCLLLVPEITLTPAVTAQLYGRFGNSVAVLHSQLAAAERAEQWQRIRSGAATVVLGTRSAVFAPLQNLGLIVVDEEHDSSYKQEESPRYHGRDVAVMRAKLLGVPILLGSATPSLESWHNAQTGRYTLLRMRQRVANRPLPAVELVDMRAEFREAGTEHLFSRRLIEQVQTTLDANQQAVILLNRRGYSRVVLCRACGERIECENCAVAMTLHRTVDGPESPLAGESLECHYCGFRRAVPLGCPACGSEHLHSLGAGAQQGEERLQEIFPHARIGRMDRDAVRNRGDMERILQRLHSGEINLLVGTQMLAKGHDIHGVTTVGVVDFDHVLGMPNFRAAERVFQLLTQVSGRAGRGDVPGRVLVQTYHPDHYAVRRAVEQDVEGFLRQEAQFRRPFHYPPYGLLANVLVRSEDLAEAVAWSNQIRGWFQAHGNQHVQMLGPAAAPVLRVKRIFRYHLLLKAGRRADLQATLRAMLAFAAQGAIPREALVLDVDPVTLS